MTEKQEKQFRRYFELLQVWNERLNLTTIIQKEDVYENIVEGAFREDGYRYSSVHRVAVSPELRGHGLGSRVFDYAVKLAHIDHALSLRCDTHEDNKPMRSLLGKCGFQYCGVVYYERNGLKEKRIAFDLLL